MCKRTGAAIAAFIIAFMSVWCPVQVVYAQSAEIETVETTESMDTEIVETTDETTDETTPPSIATDAEIEQEIRAVAIESMLQLTQGGYVYSFEDLQERLDENGEATLGTDITIPSGEVIYLADKSIHTGDYGILVEGELALGSRATITGEGVSRPVVEVLSSGSMYIYYSDFEDAPVIEATGNSGQALALRESSEYGQSDTLSFLRVKANGTGGIALKSEIPLDLKRHFIEARKGTGIICDQEVKLFLCEVLAGVSSLVAQDFTADTCDISPAAPAGGTVISRKITRLDSGAISNRGCVALGDQLPGYLSSDDYLVPFFATLHAEGYDDVFEDIYVTMDGSDIDINEIGLYPVEICPEEWMRGFDLVPEDAVLFHIEIYDPGIPYYRSSLLSYWGTYDLNFWYRADDLSGLTLWRSDDEGESWYNFTNDAVTRFDGEVLALCFDEIPDYSVWFVWKAEGIGESKILCVTWDEDDGYGGDRTGGDHGENDLPSPTLPGGGNPTMPGGETPTTPEDDPQTTPPDALPDDQTETTPPTPPTTPTTPIPDNGMQTTPSTADDGTPHPAQTAPAFRPSANSSAEYSDENSITVSGERLGVMIAANPNYVSFVRGALRVSLPTGFLQSLNDVDAFTVILYQPSEQSFIVSFAVNHKELAQSFEEPFIVSLPWMAGAVSCVSENGESVDAALNGKQATFRLHKTGSYTMMEQTASAVAITANTRLNSGHASLNTEPVPPQNDETNETPQPHTDSVVPVLIVGFVGSLCAGAYLWFSRIRRVKLH